MAKKGQKRAAAAPVTVAANGDDVVEWAKEQVGGAPPQKRVAAAAQRKKTAAAEESAATTVVEPVEASATAAEAAAAEAAAAEAAAAEAAAAEAAAAEAAAAEAAAAEAAAAEAAAAKTANNLFFDQSRDRYPTTTGHTYAAQVATDMAARLAADVAAAQAHRFALDEMRAHCKTALEEIATHRKAALDEVDRQKVAALGELAPPRRSEAPFTPPPTPYQVPVSEHLDAYDAINNALKIAMVALTEAHELVKSTKARLAASASICSFAPLSSSTSFVVPPRPAWLAAQHEDDFVADAMPGRKVQRVVDVSLTAAAATPSPEAAPAKRVVTKPQQRAQAGIMHGEDFEKDARGMY